MKQETQDLIYLARWHLLESINRDDHSLLDKAHDLITQAKADSITEEEPDRPSEPMGEANYEIPEFKIVKGTRYQTHGHYKTSTGSAKGLVVHYTVSGRTEKNARGVVNYLARKGLGCMVMDENGIIHVPENFDFQRDVAWHAGKSSWKGISGLNRHLMGMEICCWGRGSKVGPFRESKGEANIEEGKYQTYTEAQEKALENFVLWQKDINPEFSVDWLVGHDEISPGRKFDPGACLSVTMPALRDLLKD